ncbi:oligosaccharide flippase family protein [Echinicola marina]|uniref:oligosaccharide flippase family protein n=1 Tax=Echinicola marina TaxID=2859768 RepID=UPI001CF6E8EF|nr:oligosaccharide flippase family protein [Echinicola marina]UCS94384.1 oligosaccharide flippase family protein [Echinicola marina]
MLERFTSLSFSQLIRHKSIQNFIFLLFIQSSNILISLMVMPLLIQSIGVDQFGLVSLAISVILIANVFVGFGYNLSGPREVALNQKDQQALSDILSNVIFSKLLLATVATLCLAVAILGFDLFPEYQVILIYSLLMLFSEATLPVWFFQGLEKMKLVSVANVFSKLLYLLGIVLFVQAPEDAKWVNFFFGGSALLINFFLLAYVHIELGIRLYHPSLGRIFRSYRNNIYLFLSALTSHISTNGGIVILSFFASAPVLGMYSLAERVSMVLRMFPTIIIQAVFPNASKLYQNDRESFYRFLKKIYRTALFLAILITISTYVMAPVIVKVLAKSQMQESIAFLRILAFVPLFGTINIANMVLILVMDQKKILFNSSWIFCFYMIITASVLSYLFNGIGLAYSLLSTELVIFAVCSVLIHKKKPDIFNEFYRRAFGSHYSG